MKSEIKNKLLEAKDVQEVTDILTASGEKFTAEDAARIWKEIEDHKVDLKRKFSETEMAAVSGGALCQESEVQSYSFYDEECFFGDY